MAMSPDEANAIAYMLQEEARYNPNLTEVERNNYAVYAAQHIGLEKMESSVALPDQELSQ